MDCACIVFYIKNNHAVPLLDFLNLTDCGKVFANIEKNHWVIKMI
jgi:hypothetical protein